MIDLNTATLARLLDPVTFRAAVETRRTNLGRAAGHAAHQLARFIADTPEVLALLVANDLTPEQSLQSIAQAAEAATKAFHQAERDVRADRDAFMERHRAAINAAHTQRTRLDGELVRVQTRLANIPGERRAARKRLEDAGLDAEQIAKLDLPPTQREVDELHQQEHQLGAQIAALLRFAADPRREVLSGVDLAGFPVGTLPHELDAAAQAAAHQ